MTRQLRREIRFLRVYAVTSSLVLVVLCTTAFRQAATAKFDEVTVGRINVVDANGALRSSSRTRTGCTPG